MGGRSSPKPITIDAGEQGSLPGQVYRAGRPRVGATLVLAHGAGAGQSHPFMVTFAEGLAARGIDVVTFDFPYMAPRVAKKRGGPDRPPTLLAAFRAAIRTARAQPALRGQPGFVGGKSMGGRMATHLAAEQGEAADTTAAPIRGVALLGYPLHPPGRPDTPRTAHLAAIRIPMLCVQGTRDPFGTPEELRPVFEKLRAPVVLHTVETGDHSLAPLKKSGLTKEGVYAEVQDRIGAWIESVLSA